MTDTVPAPSSTTGAPTNGRRVIDVDAARRARAEARGEPLAVMIGGTEYDLPAELPADVVHHFGRVAAGDVTALEDALEVLFAGNLAAIKAEGLSWEDEKFLLEAALEEYGFELPSS